MPWADLAPNVAEAFAGPTGLTLISLGVAETIVLSPSGADHDLRRAIRKNVGSDAFGDVMLVAGYVTPVVVPAGLFVTGLASERHRALGVHGAAAAQAVAVTAFTTTLLKVVTGRPFPLNGGDPHAPDRLDHPEYAREWRPLSLEGRYAWPSGHTSAAFALASSLSASTEDVPLSIFAYSAASAVGVGMLVGDRHWSSDVLAGALLGEAVGRATGHAFRVRFLGGENGAARLVVVPRVTKTDLGVTVLAPL